MQATIIRHRHDLEIRHALNRRKQRHTGSAGGGPTDVGCPVEADGLRLACQRAGVRDRTLPFQASGQNVTEKSMSGGLGTALANNRVLADLALTHAARSANLPASEHAWILSFGLSVLP